MKALTICQPFASLIVLPDDDDRAKRVENRTWSTEYRGPLLIHAGKSRDWLDNWGGKLPDDMPFGAIIGIAYLDGCVAVERTVEKVFGIVTVRTVIPVLARNKWPWLAVHEHLEGPFAWVLRECRAFPFPIPCKGAMSLWTPPPSVQDSVNAAMAAMSLGRLCGVSK